MGSTAIDEPAALIPLLARFDLSERHSYQVSNPFTPTTSRATSATRHINLTLKNRPQSVPRQSMQSDALYAKRGDLCSAAICAKRRVLCKVPRSMQSAGFRHHLRHSKHIGHTMLDAQCVNPHPPAGASNARISLRRWPSQQLSSLRSRLSSR